MVLYGMIILLDLFKVQEKMGQTAKVVEGVILRVIPFIIFMLAWVMVFSMLHRVIGNNIDPTKTKYEKVTDFMRYFLNTWGMSLGGGSNPNSYIWFQFEDGIDDGTSYIMVFFLWLNHIGNQLLVKTFLLSFLIAIIKGSYDQQNKAEIRLSYSYRALLNKKTSNILSAFGLLFETDLIALSADYYKPPVASDASKMQVKITAMEDKVTNVQK